MFCIDVTRFNFKELFNKCQSEIFHPDFVVDLSEPDYHTAAKYAYVLSQVWSGTNPEKGKFIDLKGKYKSKFDSFKGKLTNDKWKTYFDKITVCQVLFHVVYKRDPRMAERF